MKLTLRSAAMRGLMCLPLVLTVACGGGETADEGTMATEPAETTMDSGMTDTAMDTGMMDTGMIVTGMMDTGMMDTGMMDTGMIDTGAMTTTP
jgi:hypothetical protein